MGKRQRELNTEEVYVREKRPRNVAEWLQSAALSVYGLLPAPPLDPNTGRVCLTQSDVVLSELLFRERVQRRAVATQLQLLHQCLLEASAVRIRELQPHVVVVMRHSVRLDHDGWKSAPPSLWKQRDTRPWDPPILDYNLPTEVAARLSKRYRIRRIVTSPFLRCVETAALVAKVLGVTNIEVHCKLGEWYRAVQRCCTGARVESPDVAGALSSDEVSRYLARHGLSLASWADFPITSLDVIQLPERAQGGFKSILQTNTPPGGATLCITHGDVANRYLPESPLLGEGYSGIRLHECGYVASRVPTASRIAEEDIIEQHRTEVFG